MDSHGIPWFRGIDWPFDDAEGELQQACNEAYAVGEDWRRELLDDVLPHTKADRRPEVARIALGLVELELVAVPEAVLRDGLVELEGEGVRHG